MTLPEAIHLVREKAHAEMHTNPGTPLQCAALELAQLVESLYYSSPSAKLLIDNFDKARNTPSRA